MTSIYQVAFFALETNKTFIFYSSTWICLFKTFSSNKEKQIERKREREQPKWNNFVLIHVGVHNFVTWSISNANFKSILSVVVVVIPLILSHCILITSKDDQKKRVPMMQSNLTFGMTNFQLVVLLHYTLDISAAVPIFISIFILSLCPLTSTKNSTVATNKKQLEIDPITFKRHKEKIGKKECHNNNNKNHWK